MFGKKETKEIEKEFAEFGSNIENSGSKASYGICDCPDDCQLHKKS